MGRYSSKDRRLFKRKREVGIILNQENNLFPVFSKRIALALIGKGFVLIDLRRNSKYPSYNVFMFEDTEDFQMAFSQDQGN